MSKPKYVDPMLVTGPQKEKQKAGSPVPALPLVEVRSPGASARSTPASAPTPDLGPVVGELIAASGASQTSAAGLAGLPVRRQLTRAQQHLERVRRVDESIRLKAARTVDYMMDAALVMRPEEDPEQQGSERPEGWSKRHFQTAMDARISDREAPAYIRHAARITEGFRRSEALEDRKPAPVLNCAIKVVMKSETTYNYGRIPAKDE